MVEIIVIVICNETVFLSVPQLVVKLENSLGQLSVEEFLQLYKAFYIWPPWVTSLLCTQP